MIEIGLFSLPFIAGVMYHVFAQDLLAPPSFSYAVNGNLHTFPSPTEVAIQAIRNSSLPPHSASLIAPAVYRAASLSRNQVEYFRENPILKSQNRPAGRPLSGLVSTEGLNRIRIRLKQAAEICQNFEFKTIDLNKFIECEAICFVGKVLSTALSCVLRLSLRSSVSAHYLNSKCYETKGMRMMIVYVLNNIRGISKKLNEISQLFKDFTLTRYTDCHVIDFVFREFTWFAPAEEDLNITSSKIRAVAPQHPATDLFIFLVICGLLFTFMILSTNSPKSEESRYNINNIETSHKLAYIFVSAIIWPILRSKLDEKPPYIKFQKKFGESLCTQMSRMLTDTFFRNPVRYPENVEYPTFFGYPILHSSRISDVRYPTRKDKDNLNRD
ncbi:hypothetical protein G5I_08966 [Acromyrmex echinatior]|uniref:Uncharacterized protein n=1 Tax=Acromyrmex echinatior TaxID=103372 RepID=F4WSX4_ACREC|nr:hypothetical protein G5I_08966 [Acromyrmex echinatior]